MSNFPNIANNIDYALITEKKLQARIEEIAFQIEADYAGIDLLLICVLKGGYIFLSDLSRAIKMSHHVDFMAVSSYEGKSTESSGVVQIMMDLKQPLAGRHVLIVEDIIDSGRTLSYLRQLLLAREPASLEICTLLTKPSRREVDVDVKYIGFEIPDEFVVGYGLDFDEYYRNLPYIAVLKPETFAHLNA
ncbi:MAG: hypoxanthine phosphoribosyltransferase [Chloroflexota bacterium]